jgi:hypothetical protein
MLTYLREVLGDAIPFWMKAAAPGAFAAIYCLFLGAALPDVGLSLLQTADPAAALVPAPALRSGLDASWSWVVRFGVLFTFLAGVPGVLGAMAGIIGGLGSGARR